MARTHIITSGSWSPELFLGSSEITTGFTFIAGRYLRFGTGARTVYLASFWIKRPSLNASDDFVSIRNFPDNDKTVSVGGGSNEKAPGVFTDSSLLSGGDASTWPRMRLDLANSYCYVNANQGLEGRTSWNFSDHDFRIQGVMLYPVDLS